MEKMKSLKAVARETGYSYESLRYYVKKYEKNLVNEGVLEVKENLASKRYYVHDPGRLIATLKKLIKEERK